MKITNWTMPTYLSMRLRYSAVKMWQKYIVGAEDLSLVKMAHACNRGVTKISAPAVNSRRP